MIAFIVPSRHHGDMTLHINELLTVWLNKYKKNTIIIRVYEIKRIDQSIAH